MRRTNALVNDSPRSRHDERFHEDSHIITNPTRIQLRLTFRSSLAFPRSYLASSERTPRYFIASATGFDCLHEDLHIVTELLRTTLENVQKYPLKWKRIKVNKHPFVFSFQNLRSSRSSLLVLQVCVTHAHQLVSPFRTPTSLTLLDSPVLLAAATLPFHNLLSCSTP